MTVRIVAVAVFAVASAQLGCADDRASVDASDDSFSTVANGLWALDGTAEHGDIELLQLDQRSFASITHQEAPAADTAPHAMGAAASAPAPTPRATTGSLARAHRAAPISLVDGDQTYTVTETADSLTLKSAEGRVLTYHRSYRLYCVDNDRSVEATVVLELGKEPKIVGVNGDGRTFPSEGSYAAAVRSDVLFRLADYVLTSQLDNGALVTVKLPWAEMSKPTIQGTIAISGIANAAPPTALSCERVHTPAIPTTSP